MSAREGSSSDDGHDAVKDGERRPWPTFRTERERREDRDADRWERNGA